MVPSPSLSLGTRPQLCTATPRVLQLGTIRVGILPERYESVELLNRPLPHPLLLIQETQAVPIEWIYESAVIAAGIEAYQPLIRRNGPLTVSESHKCPGTEISLRWEIVPYHALCVESSQRNGVERVGMCEAY
jgi:hypothetical protein